jgi:divalent metal cation (Fe/Co/Zn/Cd) transporter
MPSRERRLNEESNTNAKENKNLKNLNVSKTAQYKSPEVVAELLDLMSSETQNNVLDEMRNSPTYSLMVDVVMDIASHKHLAICARYIGPDFKIKIVIVSDPRIPGGRAETITDTIKNELSKSNLNINDVIFWI